MKYNEITTSQIFLIHQLLVNEYKITKGCMNKGTIDSLLNKIDYLDNDDLYKNAAILFEGLIRLHPFIDGNKRTALQSIKQYLNMNNHVLVFPLSTVAFTYKISRKIKTDPESNEKIINDTCTWIKLFSTPITKKGYLRMQSILNIYYVLPNKLMKICLSLKLKFMAKWIIRLWIRVPLDERKSDLFEFVIELMYNQVKMQHEKHAKL